MREADYRQAITQPTDVRAESASAVDQLVPPVVVTENKISETSKSGGRAIQLDAVRGIAILAVLEFHFKTVPVHNALARGFEYIGKRIGWMGVDLFFVLSGFLIGGLLVQELLASDDIDIRRFLMRRALKIWPAYYVYILFQIIVRKHPLGSFAWQNLLNVQNYVGTSLNHTWSLAVEEQFYLVLPVVLWFCYRKHRARIPVVLAAMCFLVLVGRCIAVYWLGQPNPQWKTHARIDSLLFGVVMSWFFYSQRARFDRILKYRLALLGTSAAGLLFAFKLGLNDPLMWTVGYTANYLALGALMLLVYQYRGSLIHSKAYKALAWIGVYSYGIYLWHLSVRDPLAKVAAHLPISIRWGCLLLSQYAAAIVLGYLMTQLVEFPMLRVRERIFPRGPAALAPNRP